VENIQLDLNHKSIKRTIYKSLVFIIVTLIGLNIMFMPVKVIGKSMENTIRDGDKYIVNKLEYLFDKPKYKDIILIESYKSDKKYYIIKRVIGEPGDTILIEDNEIYINGELLKEEYIKKNIKYTNEKIEVKLKDDEVFVMGDNRGNSRDSRSKAVGAINTEQVVGKAILKYYSKK